MSSNNDKNYVVIKNGERASGLLTQEAAAKEVAKIRTQINEKSGATANESKVTVKQNLCG